MANEVPIETPPCRGDTSTTSVHNQILDVVIVGGGLSGMTIAYELQQKYPSKCWQLHEANSILGGRLINDPDGMEIDMGGAWMFPNQTLLQNLLNSLDIPTFPQPEFHERKRIVGGAVSIITKLREHLPEKNIYVNSPIISCKRTKSSIGDYSIVLLETSSGFQIRCKRVIFTIPPKLLLSKNNTITFDPPLCSAKQDAIFKSGGTWMAGVTKVSLAYATRFWSIEEGSGGDSWRMLQYKRNAPAYQVYDGSSYNDRTYALTFFAVASLSDEGDNDETLAKQCAMQLVQEWSTLDGCPETMRNDVMDYKSYYVKRWSKEPYISDGAVLKTVEELETLLTPISNLARNDWDGDMILFAGAETDLAVPGLMEGAIGSSKRTMAELEKLWNVADTKSFT